MKLLHLPVDSLLYIFNQKFTLQELLHLRGLCRPLCDLIESSYCIGRRRTLKLFWSFEDVCRYPGHLFRYGLENVKELRLKSIGRDDDDLIVWRVECFGGVGREMLMRLMPNVRHLVVYFGPSLVAANYDIVLEVIKCWSRLPLTGLSLFGLFESNKLSQLRTRFPAQMVKSINKLWRHLTVLDLCVDGLFCNGYHQDNGTELASWLQDVSTFHPELFPRLRRLYFVNSNAVDLIRRFSTRTSTPISASASTLTYTSGCLTQLGYDYTCEIDGSAYNALCALSASSQLTHLRFAGDLAYLSRLVDYIPRIESLEVVQMLLAETLEQALVPQLNQLIHLTHLTLNWFDFSVFEGGQSRFPVLARIAKLKLVHSHVHSNRSLYRLKCPASFFGTIALIFPNITQLTLSLGYVFHDDTNRTVLIDPSVHLDQFELLTRFCYVVLFYSTGTFHHLLSGQHRWRYRREMTSRLQWTTTLQQIELGYSGVQLWAKTAGGGHIWRKMHPTECVPHSDGV